MSLVCFFRNAEAAGGKTSCAVFTLCNTYSTYSAGPYRREYWITFDSDKYIVHIFFQVYIYVCRKQKRTFVGIYIGMYRVV